MRFLFVSLYQLSLPSPTILFFPQFFCQTRYFSILFVQSWSLFADFWTLGSAASLEWGVASQLLRWRRWRRGFSNSPSPLSQPLRFLFSTCPNTGHFFTGPPLKSAVCWRRSSNIQLRDEVKIHRHGKVPLRGYPHPGASTDQIFLKS